ncbi:GNAT family N-acetyltransferase [Candidatus Woesearchaeota archaeon]|nr:GNAT family N-acetyltransferase [Candidatus Woesearchaeota archaeon]
MSIPKRDVIKIGKANKGDIQRIRKIDNFGEEILSNCSPLDKLDPKYKLKKGEKNYYEKFILGKNKWCYIAESEGKLLGYILFNIEKREPYWKIKKVGYLDLIVIDKKERGKGISKLLFKKAYEIFKEKKLEYAKLSVQTDNDFAHKIWKKFGFKDFRVDMYRQLRKL